VVSYDDFGSMAGGRDRERNGWYGNGQQGVSVPEAKPRWLSCTPLLGSDDAPGVWMVIMVEDPNPGRVVGVRTADRIARTNDISNSIGSISNDHSNRHTTEHSNRHTNTLTNGHTNGYANGPNNGNYHHTQSNSFSSATLPTHPPARKLKSPSIEPLRNGNSNPQLDPNSHADAHLLAQHPLIHMRSAEALRAPQISLSPSPPAPTSPTSPTSPAFRTATLSNGASLLHASKSTTAAENRMRRNPPLGSWSPTLSAEAVESWIPTGYGGGMVGLVPGGRGRVDFVHARGKGEEGGE